MRVLKRSGEHEDVSFDKVLNRIRLLSNELNVDIYDIGQKVCSRIYDGVKTSELDELAAHICSSMIIDNPDYGVLAARLTISNHHKNTSPSFSETMNTLYNNRVNGELSPLINDALYGITMKNKEKLNSYIDYNRDYTFDYFGFKTLERSYLIKIDGKIVERPQHMFMRVALGIHSDDLKEALQTYDLMSRKFFTHATPTLFNSGTVTPQLSSCYLVGMQSDSLDGIFETVKDCARISKYAGGIGLHVHNIRAKGSRIRTTNGTSDGLVPMLKVFNYTGRYINQCFAPETLVFTSGGVAQIKDINEGDEVVTLDKDSNSAILKRVLGVKRQSVNKTILQIKTSIGTAPVRVTKEHELYVKRSIGEAEYIPASDLKVGDSMGYPEKDGMFWFQVSSIEEVPYEGDVYDLNIEDNHNYTVVNLGLVHNSGKRNGSIAIYLEPWHADIEAFLDLKKNHGNEEDRARDLFYAVWVPDLFMERVKSGAAWSLMCPDQSPGLADVYGDAFNKLYEQYEREGKYVRQVKAQDIWFRIMETQIETGVPYVGFKDAANRKSNQQNLGTIKSSNLCVAGETLVLTSKGHLPIESLKDQEVEVWNGEEFSLVTIRKTGENQEMINVSFNNGKAIRCTPYHKFYIRDSVKVDAKDLKVGDPIVPYKLPFSDETYYVRVVSVENAERCDTYCFNEPKRHTGIFNGVLAGNCMEIVEYSDANECSVCNLSSLCLPTYVITAEDGSRTFDFDKLHEVVMVAAKNLNKIIDINFYPLEKARRSNLRHRPIGIGVQGLADTYILMGYPFDSEEASRLNKDIFETIYHAAVEASVLIAKKRHEAVLELRSLKAEADKTRSHSSRIEEINRYLNLNEYENIDGDYPGAYSTFEGSPASRGQLQFDLWGVQPHSDRYDWSSLKGMLSQYGMRNSLLVAPMPTASTSQIMGFTESFECITSNLYKRKTLAGEFVVVNKYLISDLQKLGMWNKDTKNMIMLGEGSVQHIKEIPEKTRRLYKTAWEVSQKTMIDQAADRGPYICQSQSMNLFVAEPDFQVLTSMLFYSWQKGLKTGSYYIRSKPTAKVQQFTIDPSIQAKMSPARKKVPPKECVPDPDTGACMMCQG